MRRRTYADRMYIEPTDENGRLLFERGIAGPVSMLNLLRFREIADYSAYPHLASSEPISGRQAYDIYSAHTMPFLLEAGGEVQFSGEGGHNFIGPLDERWDRVLIVRYPKIDALMGMVNNEAYMSGLGHRTAALEDSRLLPMVQQQL